MRIPSLTMAGSAKEIAITFCFIGLMVGSLCVGSVNGQTLNQQEQEKVSSASTRRRLLPELSGTHHSPSPAPKELYYTPPATPTSKESYALPGPPAATQNQAAYKSVNCGDRLCPGIRIGRNIFVLEFEN